MTKQELRYFIRQQKHCHTEQFPAWSQAICRVIRQTPQWQQARTVLLYHALSDEPNLEPLFSADKELLLPVVVGDDLVLRYYRDNTSLQEGAFHIMEPTGDDFSIERYSEICLVLVPGMAFDKDGHRLGRGRGYYDRLLPRLSQACKLGVCFPFQVVDCVPYEPHDIAVNRLITVE